MCIDAQAVIGTAVAAVNHCLPGPHLPRLTRDIAAALNTMPLSSNERSRLAAALLSAPSEDMAMWQRMRQPLKSETPRPDGCSPNRAQARKNATLDHTAGMYLAARDMADTAAEITESRRSGTAWHGSEAAGSVTGSGLPG